VSRAGAAETVIIGRVVGGLAMCLVRCNDDQRHPRVLELVRAPEASRTAAPQSAAARLVE